MALVVADRVRETTTTVGTGAFALGGAQAGYQAFSAVMTNGDTTYYACASTTDWEVGVGTWNTGNTLTRTTILASSNGGSIVNFGAGSKDIFISYPASRAVYQNAAGTSTVQDAFSTATIGTANITTANITAGTVSTTPSTGNDIANKTYVDTMASSGITYHSPVKYEVPNTTGNLNAIYNQPGGPGVGVGATLTNNGTLAAFAPDGPTAAPGDRILVYNQTNAFENGVYTVTTVGSGSVAWVLTRATDADTYGVKSPNALGLGDAFFITSGNTGAGETYVCNTSGVITFGTTAINFVQVSSAQIYSAGTGLTLSGTQFSISNTGVSASTYGSASAVPVIAVNAQGQITTATNTTIAITGAQVSGNIAGSAGSVANALTAGTYLTSGGTFDGSVARTFAVDATSANTASKVVARDASGNFSAGTITATLSGNATSANTATNISGGAANQIPFQASAGTTTFSSSLTFNGVTLTAADIADTSLTAGRVTYAGSGGNLTDSANLVFDGTNLGIGTSSPGSKLTVSGTNSPSSPLVNLTASGSGAFQRGVRLLNSGMTAGDSLMYAVGQADSSKNMGQFYFYYAGAGSNSNRISMGLHSVDDVLNIFGSGNTQIGSTTDAGYKLGVTGTFNASGAITQNGSQVLTAGNYNSYAPTLTGTGASGTWAINITGSAGASTSVNATTSTGIQTSYSSTINTTTPGTGTYGINFSGGGTPDYAQGITWAWSSSGSQAGIYVQSSGSYGTKMYLATTDSFATGSRTAISIDHTGLVQTVRNYFQAVGSVRAPIFYDSDNTSYYGDFAGTSVFNVARMNGVDFSNGNSAITLNSGTYLMLRDTTGRVGIYIGGTADTANYYDNSAHNFRDRSGSQYAYINASGMFAPVFYDSNDTGYYGDFANTGTAINVNGSIVINNGAASNTHGLKLNGANSRIWFHGYRAMEASTSAVNLQVGESFAYTEMYGSSRAPLFYDSGNTGYYVDPASTSYLYALNLAGGGYFQPNNWIQFNGVYGLYWPSYYGAHLRANDLSTYTQIAIQGSKNSYGGILDYYSGVNGIMYDSGGNGGVYREANGRWFFYYNVGNDCMGIGTSSTSSSYSLYLTKGVYAQNRIDATIFYDTNNTGYYADPASTSNVNQINMQGYLRRNTSAAGYLEGYYGNATDSNTSNCIYTIGGSYQPGSSSLGNMYGVGYTVGNGTTNPGLGMTGWGFYVASGGVSRVFLDSDSGIVISSGSSRAPIFYDSNDTGYYIDPNGGSIVSNIYTYNASTGFTARYTAGSNSYAGFLNWYGVQLGNNGANYLVAGRTSANGYFDVYVNNTSDFPTVNGTHSSRFSSDGIFYNYYSVRTPIFYDYNNTGYYVDPASTSYLTNVQATDWFRPVGDCGLYFQSYGYGLWSAHSAGNSYGNASTYGTGRNGWTGWGLYSRFCWMTDINNGGSTMGMHDNSYGWVWRWIPDSYFSVDRGYSIFNSSARAPIFYDSNDTNYYLDPTATTSLRTVGSWRSDSSSWDGEFAGKMQYHSSNWYLQFSSNMIFRNSGGTNVMTCDSSGNVTFNGNVTAYSDARIKENVVTIDSALQKVLGLRGVYYNKIGNPERRVGVIAQEVVDVLPEVVRSISDTNPSTDETKELLAVDYGNMVGLLIEAIKEQQSQIKALKAELNALWAKLGA